MQIRNMENFEEQYAVLERCTAENPKIGTEEYNLINGPLDMFKNYISGLIEHEHKSNNSYDEQSKKALENMYSLVHSPESNISSHDRVELCKVIATIIDHNKEVTTTASKETTIRVENAAKYATITTAIATLAKLIEPLVKQYVDNKNKSWWERTFG